MLELKSIVSEQKILRERLDSILEQAEERASKLEDGSPGILWCEKQKEKRIK